MLIQATYPPVSLLIHRLIRCWRYTAEWPVYLSTASTGVIIHIFAPSHSAGRKGIKLAAVINQDMKSRLLLSNLPTSTNYSGYKLFSRPKQILAAGTVKDWALTISIWRMGSSGRPMLGLTFHDCTSRWDFLNFPNMSKFQF